MKFKKLKYVGFSFLAVLLLMVFAVITSGGESTTEPETPVVEVQADEAKETENKKIKELEAELAEAKAKEEAREKEDAEAKQKAQEEADQRAKDAEEAEKLVTDTKSVEEDMLFEVLKDSMEGTGDVSFDRENKTFIITPTSEDFGTEFLMMVSGAKSDQDWNFMVDSFEELSRTIQDALGDGYALTMANPSNSENVILVIIDGVTVYDVFKDQ